MRQIAWPNIPGKLDEAWRRFRALSWKWKALALSLASLCALGAALLVVAVAGGGGGDAGPRRFLCRLGWRAMVHFFSPLLLVQ